MAKLTNEQRIKIYERRLKGESLKTLALEFNVNFHRVEYLVRLLSKHGYEILRNKKNRAYSKEFKEFAINRVLLEKKIKPLLLLTLDLVQKEFYIIGLKNIKKTAIMS